MNDTNFRIVGDSPSRLRPASGSLVGLMAEHEAYATGSDDDLLATRAAFFRLKLRLKLSARAGCEATTIQSPGGDFWVQFNAPNKRQYFVDGHLLDALHRSLAMADAIRAGEYEVAEALNRI